MEANITIKIGCEAGSKYCKGCVVAEIAGINICEIHDNTKLKIAVAMGEDEEFLYETCIRCQQCLDAEKPTNDIILREGIEKSIKELREEEEDSTDSFYLIRNMVTSLEELLKKTEG